MDSSERYEQARRLIKSSQFQEARNMLLPIRYEARAADWIQKIDTHLANTSSKKQLVKPSPRTPSWVTITIVALLATFTFIAGLAVGGYTLDLNSGPTPESKQIMVVITATSPPATETPTPTTTPTLTEIPVPTVTPLASETPSSGLDTDDATTGKWVFNSDVSALDDTSSYFITLDAEDSISAWLSNPTPTLIIRCENHEYDVFIFADTQLDSTLDDEVFTRVRYGDDPARSITMGESTTGEAMFFPLGAIAVHNLLDVNRLVVGFTPFNANPVEAVFDITGIETAMQPLFDECGKP